MNDATVKLVDYEDRGPERDIEKVFAGFSSGLIKDGAAVKVKGSIHRIKQMADFAFVSVRAPRLVFQCIWEKDVSGCDIKDFAPEECVNIDGLLHADDRSPVGFDIRIRRMERVSGRTAPLPVELSNDRRIAGLKLATLLDNRILTLRNPRVRAAMRIADGVMFAFREFLHGEDFVEFVPPKIVEAGAEGGADMFEVDYFGRKAFLNQSPQMYKQAMVGVFTKVYTVGPVFRAEKFSTNRHINEFQGLDLEMGFIESFEDLIKLESRMFRHIYASLNSGYSRELEMFFGRGGRLPELKSFPQIRFSDAKKLYADAHPTRDGLHVLAEPDFSPDEEKWLGDYFNRNYGSPIVFVTHYPASKRPFYTMDDPEDPRYTLSYDMLLNGLEVTTGGQRIHDYEAQVAKMKKRGMNIDDFEDYLTMHKYGMPPHGGMGLGLERIVENILGLESIKLATAFPRDRERLRP